MNAFVTLQAADVFATRGRGFFSKLIRLFTRRIGEGRTQVNHVGVVVEGGTVKEAAVVEALFRVRRHGLASRYGRGSSSDVAVFRPINLDDDQRRAIVAKAETYVGRRYGVLKLATHFLDWVLQGAYIFRRLTQSDRYPICSWLVAHAFKAVGKHFGKSAGAASPDAIWDFVIANPDKYKTIIPLGSLDSYLD